MGLYPKNNIFSHDKKKWAMVDHWFGLILQVQENTVNERFEFIFFVTVFLKRHIFQKI